jgi:hypothetical protein
LRLFRTFNQGPVGLQQSLQLFSAGQGDEVAGDEEFLVHAGGSEFHGGFVPVAAQDDADGRIVAFFRRHPRLPFVVLVIFIALVILAVALFAGLAKLFGKKKSA